MQARKEINAKASTIGEKGADIAKLFDVQDEESANKRELLIDMVKEVATSSAKLNKVVRHTKKLNVVLYNGNKCLVVELQGHCCQRESPGPE